MDKPSRASFRRIDYAKAAAFVFSLPAQPVNLVSIDPTGASPPRAQTFKRPDIGCEVDGQRASRRTQSVLSGLRAERHQ